MFTKYARECITSNRKDTVKRKKLAVVHVNKYCLSFRERYKLRPTKIFLHICCNLMVGYNVFVAGNDDVKDSLFCTAVAVLLKYFFLATWCWMCEYSYDLYHSIIIVRCSKYIFMTVNPHAVDKYITFSLSFIPDFKKYFYCKKFLFYVWLIYTSWRVLDVSMFKAYTKLSPRY